MNKKNKSEVDIKELKKQIDNVKSEILKHKKVIGNDDINKIKILPRVEEAISVLDQKLLI